VSTVIETTAYDTVGRGSRMSIKESIARRAHLTRELGQGIIIVALGGTSVGGVLGMVAVATRALGR
jgi:hypothetical protein